MVIAAVRTYDTLVLRTGSNEKVETTSLGMQSDETLEVEKNAIGSRHGDRHAVWIWNRAARPRLLRH